MRALLLLLAVAVPALAGPEASAVKVHYGAFAGSGSVVRAAAGHSLVLTNRHVCPDAKQKASVDLPGGRTVTARWLGADDQADLAVLEVPGELPVLPIAEADPAVGARVVLYGFGGGFRYGDFEGFRGDGGRDEVYGPIGPAVGFAFTSIPGDSGAALVHDGKLVGVCRGNDARNHGVAVRATEARRVLAKYAAPAPATGEAPGKGAAPAPPRVAPAVSRPHAGELRAALADAQRLPAPVAARTRYLTLYAVPDKDRPRWRLVLTHWTNALSREAEFARPRRVTDTVFAVVLDDYGWQARTWESLAAEDPYFHVLLDQGGRKAAALAPWLPAAEGARLVALTQSAAPLVRGDWWFARSAIQFNRQGTGYYDWLGLQELKDFDALIAFDRKKAQGVQKEVAAIVARSGVANFPRQVFREAALTGGRWETRDQVVDNRDERNALRQLLDDLKPAAFEIYGVLPNGLFCYFLADGQGKRQDSAPDGVGPDKTAPGNDGKIHVGLSCTRCHLEGLRPLTDWARRVYAGPLALTGADPDVHRRLVRVYLGELQEHLDEDTAAYARRLKRLTGWAPAELAAAIGSSWAWYQEADLLPADVAAELGLEEAVYLERLRAYYTANTLADPVLASHLARPPLPIRRDDVEQLYPLVAPVALAEPPK